MLMSLPIVEALFSQQHHGAVALVGIERCAQVKHTGAIKHAVTAHDFDVSKQGLVAHRDLVAGFVVDALRTGEFVSAGYLVGRASGQPIITFALPVRDKGGPAGSVVFASMYLSGFSRDINQIQLPIVSPPDDIFWFNISMNKS